MLTYVLVYVLVLAASAYLTAKFVRWSQLHVTAPVSRLNVAASQPAVLHALAEVSHHWHAIVMAASASESVHVVVVVVVVVTAPLDASVVVLTTGVSERLVFVVVKPVCPDSHRSSSSSTSSSKSEPIWSPLGDSDAYARLVAATKS